MVAKRHFRDDEGSEDFEFPVPESKRRPTFRDVVRDVMRDATLNERESERLRRIVREEVERGILPFLVSSPNISRPPPESGSTSGGCGLQLHFINKLPSTIFTGSKVEAENGTPLQIELVDASTGATVCSGPLSSLKIELLVVNGEFGSDDQEDWTEQEFNNYIVRARDGKMPLVTGETHVTLREGVGFVGDVVFTDNSSWIRSRKFRLAARVVAKSPSEVRIGEARSEPFVVKDHRGELYKKHYPPHLNDEIWRLEKIEKDGAFHKNLCENGISTVEDFLQLYMRDASLLRNAFGVISNKIWETIIEHAMACKLDDHKRYAYHRAEHDVSLMFNSVHRLVGAIINGQFCSLDELDAHQKMLVETLKQHAYRNVRDLVPVDVSTIFGLSRPLPCPQAEQFKNQLAIGGRDAMLNERESERFFQRIVREEVERGILPFLMSSPRHSTSLVSQPGASGVSMNLPVLSLGGCNDGDCKEVSSLASTSIGKTPPTCQAFVAVPPISMKALAVVPFHRKSGHQEYVQRQIRRPFSVPEVEALVQAVEKLGTGRWRDVKLLAFESEKHRTYIDLKDKWKTLVHTAMISPQQRRGEPVPQEILDRVLAAHAYWSLRHA